MVECKPFCKHASPQLRKEQCLTKAVFLHEVLELPLLKKLMSDDDHSVNLTSDKQDTISVVASAVSLVLILDRKTGTQTISTPQPFLHVIVIRPPLSGQKTITHRMCICSKHC